jgi:hypothetical protein
MVAQFNIGHFGKFFSAFLTESNVFFTEFFIVVSFILQGFFEITAKHSSLQYDKNMTRLNSFQFLHKKTPEVNRNFVIIQWNFH